MNEVMNCSREGWNTTLIPDVQVFVDVELDQQFRRDGYIVQPLLDQAEVEQLTQLHNQYLPELEGDFYTTAYISDPDVRYAAANAIESVLLPHVQPLLCGYKSAANNFVSKKPTTKRGKKFAHQDYTFVDQSRCTGVHIWIPLVDVDENNGALVVYPGTHALVNHISATLPRPGTTDYDSPYTAVLALLEARCGLHIPVRAGSAIFFNERTLHASGENETGGTRMAVTAAYIPENEPMRLYCPSVERRNYLDILTPSKYTDLVVVPGKPMPYPYPDCYTVIGSIEYHPEPLTPEKLQPLFISQSADTEVVSHSSPAATVAPQAPASVPATANNEAVAERRGGVLGWLGRNRK